MSSNIAKPPGPLAAWILLCAYLNCAGWLLSALNCLNATGYAVVVLAGAMGAVVLQKTGWVNLVPTCNLYRQKRRFSRLFPACYLVLAGLTFLGGLLHAPSNFDALAYRLPRLLHWLSEGHWHWIHAMFNRLNTRSCGYEWVAAPIIALTKSDRPLFLIDFASFLLLPGLFFGILCRLGISRRAAWHWMWILATGYNYLVQAGSIGNDMFGGVFALASVDLALRARASRRYGDLALSILAMALLTGGKTSNVPLGLPWVIIVLPVLPLLLKRLAVTAVIGVVAALASFIPMAAINYHYCGDWTGWAAEQTVIGKGRPLLQISYNCLILTVENFAPPIFPFAKQWNAAMPKIIPKHLAETLALTFEPTQAQLNVPEIQMEETAGLGFGISVLVALSLIANWRRRRDNLAGSRPLAWWQLGALVAPWIALIPFLAKAGWASAARLTTPYEGLLIPILLIGSAQGIIVKQAWFRRTAVFMFFLAALVVILSPQRPLWPAQTILAKLPPSRTQQRAAAVYAVYGERADALGPVRAVIPKDADWVGLVTFDDPEATLWHPFGSGFRFRHVKPEDSLAVLQASGIKYILVSEDRFKIFFGEPLDKWLARINGRVLQTVPVTLRVSQGPVNWWLIEVPGPGKAANESDAVTKIGG